MRQWFKRHLGVFVEPLDMTAEEADFVRAALLRRDEHIAQLCGIMGMIFHLVGFVVDPFLVPRYLDLTSFVHTFVLGILLLWFTVLYRFQKPFRFYLWSVQAVMVGLYSFGLYLSLTRTTDMMDALIASSSVLSLALIMLAMCPFHGWMVPVTAILYWTMTAIGFMPAGRMWPFLYVHGLVMFNGLLFQQGLIRRQRYYAVQELRSSKLAAENEQLKVEQEMLAAREVHESLLPPPRSLHAGHLTATLFHRTHSKIGGDWMALREFDDGRLAIVVADATGKGIQAALVIHAVQSLWAESLCESDLDPEHWLRRVNAALCKMGAKTLHTLTMGLVVISENELRYWSAGHLPVYVCWDHQGRHEVRTVHGKGNPLGLFPEAEFLSNVMHFTAGDELDVLLGTDGLFHKGTLHTGKDIDHILDTLRTDPERVYDIGQGDDDKTLVWVRKEAA